MDAKLEPRGEGCTGALSPPASPPSSVSGDDAAEPKKTSTEITNSEPTSSGSGGEQDENGWLGFEELRETRRKAAEVIEKDLSQFTFRHLANLERLTRPGGKEHQHLTKGKCRKDGGTEAPARDASKDELWDTASEQDGTQPPPTVVWRAVTPEPEEMELPEPVKFWTVGSGTMNAMLAVDTASGKLLATVAGVDPFRGAEQEQEQEDAPVLVADSAPEPKESKESKESKEPLTRAEKEKLRKKAQKAKAKARKAAATGPARPKPTEAERMKAGALAYIQGG